MKAIVTGGAGFIGSHVVEAYLNNGMEVVIIDDLSTGRRSNINPKATFYQVDIRDPQVDEIFAREKPDIVNHHAAQMNVRRSVADPLFDADVNILGSLKLIEAAKKHGVQHFIYISSGGAAYGEPVYLPCDENHPINPICQYGISKHTVEHYLYLYNELYGLKYTVLRYPNVYGPRQDPHGEAGVVAIFTRQMLNNEPVTINGDGEQVRDYVNVRDCAKANVLAIGNPDSTGIFNIGSGVGTTVNEIFAQLKEITGYTQNAIYGPAKLGETRRIYLNADKACRLLGWQQTLSLREGLTDLVHNFKVYEPGQ